MAAEVESDAAAAVEDADDAKILADLIESSCSRWKFLRFFFGSSGEVTSLVLPMLTSKSSERFFRSSASGDGLNDG